MNEPTVLTDAERQFLTFALDLADDRMAERGDEFGDDDEAALETLRQLAAGQSAEQAQPPRHRWRVESLDNLADEWAPGTPFLNRHHAVERYDAVNDSHSTWKDGTPVKRRIVRETTTYTIEATNTPE
jgi:hypothetical protein